MAADGALSALDEYRFEAGGWLVLPAVLTAEQVACLNTRVDEPHSVVATDDGLLGAHPSVRATLDLLMGRTPAAVKEAAVSGSPPAHVQLRPPALLRDGGSLGFLEQWADGKLRDHSKHYQTHHGTRVCKGVCAVWCLDEGSDFLLVPGSHASSVRLP